MLQQCPDSPAAAYTCGSDNQKDRRIVILCASDINHGVNYAVKPPVIALSRATLLLHV